MLKSTIINTIYAIAILLVLVWLFVFNSSQINLAVYLIIGFTFIWFVITVIGSFHFKWNYFLEGIHSNKQIKANEIAITFDDGPHPEFTPKVLDLLNKYNAKATFFCIGKYIEKHPEIVKTILDQGHTIGNHTYSHENSFGFYKTAKVVKDLEKTNEIITKHFSLTPQLFRPAFGVTNPRIARAVKYLRFTSIGWNIRSLDTTKRSEKVILNRIVPKVSKGDVILLHDTSEKTVIVLEQLLQFLEKENLKSTTVDSLFKIQAYA